MKTFKTAAAMSEFSKGAHEAGQKIAFVPTMGALHEGHLALMREARRHGDVLVVSIFVNPKQFNNPQDYEKYARDPKDDLKKCEAAGVDLVFAPTVKEMYPADDPAPVIPLPEVAKPLEGVSRPGHFEGVVAVVSRLFRIIRPDVAVFGMKDYQQIRVIEEMVASGKMTVKILRHPTVREKDGLAMSSRNARLSAAGHRKASALSRALRKAETLYKGGERDPRRLEREIKNFLEAAGGVTVDYVAVVDADTLSNRGTPEAPPIMIAALAAFVEGVRLIDNCLLKPI